jgi:BirA family biotin operon repressor/biotin-[acetyl-CoA-carboxylase] ligase
MDEVDSTNAEGVRCAKELAEPTWILARRQVAGRGRRGRAWQDPPGNFAATLVIPRPGPPARAALRSFVAALGLYDALAALTGRGASLSLKWPNDVLIDGHKIAGILLELHGPVDEPGPLCVGIGVNLTSAPDARGLEPGATQPVSLHAVLGRDLLPEEFLEHLAPPVAEWEAMLQSHGFAPLRRAFLDRADRLGEVVTARTPQRAVRGRFADIDKAGAVVLEAPEGRLAVTAAEIFF